MTTVTLTFEPLTPNSTETINKLQALLTLSLNQIGAEVVKNYNKNLKHLCFFCINLEALEAFKSYYVLHYLSMCL